MTRRAVRSQALVAAGLVLASLVAACTGHPRGDGAVGAAGGTVSGADGQVTLTVPPQAGTSDATVKVTSQPAVVPPGATGFVPLAGFNVDVTRGTVSRGQVSVRYTDAQVAKAGSNPGLLVILVSDHHGGWTPLPTQVNPAAHTATAVFPHFSGGELGVVKSVSSWFVNHVATWGLGPEKKPDCQQNGAWLGPDGGWSADNTNWSGGRIMVNPLSACVELERPGRSTQHVDATNRYWYAFDLALPPKSTVSFDDADQADSFSDFLLDELYYHFFNATIIPGHSFAQFTVPSSPSGQVLRQSAVADPVSIVVNAITSILTVASVGELKAQEAAFDAAETGLDAQLKGADKLAEVAEMTAVGSDWRNQLDAKLAAEYGDHGAARSVVDGYMNAYSVAGCAVDHNLRYLPHGASFGTAVSDAWKHIDKITQNTAEGCWQYILGAALGASIKTITAQYSPQSGLALARALLSPKSIQGTVEAGMAAQAKEILGANYYATKLILTQLSAPPSTLTAFRTPDGSIRCYSLATAITGSYEGVSAGDAQSLPPGVYCFVDAQANENLPAGVTGAVTCTEPEFISITDLAVSPQGWCTGDAAIESKMPGAGTSLAVAQVGQSVDLGGAVCQVDTSGRQVLCASTTSAKGAEIFEANTNSMSSEAGSRYASGCSVKGSAVSCQETSDFPD
jgi:hypothetical protein